MQLTHTHSHNLPRASRLYTQGWFWLALALWGVYFAFAWFTAQYGAYGKVDYRVYYNAANAFAEGTNPYLDTAPYLYPPLLANLLTPLALTTSLETSWAIWFTTNCAIMLGTLALGWYADPQRRRIIWFAPLLFLGIHEALVTGQVTIVLMGIFALVWWAYRNSHPLWVGVLLALAAWLKLYPALLIIYFLWKRDWRVVSSAVIAGAALLVIQLIVMPPELLQPMVETIFALSDSGQMTLLSGNSSILGMSLQWFNGGERVTPIFYSVELASFMRIGLSVFLFGIGTWITYPHDHAGSNKRKETAYNPDYFRRFDLEYSLVLLTALLLSPTLWVSGMPPLLICLYLIWRHGGKRVGWFCLLALLGLTAYYVYVIGYNPALMNSGLIAAFGFYILIAIWAVNVWLLLPFRRTAPPVQTP
jgi:hypothetical protein